MKYINETIEYIKKCVENTEDGNVYLESFTMEEKIHILLNAKQLLAYVAIDKGENMSNACYHCKYRSNIPGDAHSACINPLAYAIGDEHGIKNGWFLHPYNFDPIWLCYCDGFEKYESI